MAETLSGHFGHIESYSEQGIGPVSVFRDSSQSGWDWDAEYPLRDGDILTIFNDAARQKVLWGPTVLKFKHQHMHPDFYPEGINERRWNSFMRQKKPANVVIDPKNQATWDEFMQRRKDLTP